MVMCVVVMIVTGVLIVCYLTYLVENLSLPWFKVEFMLCVFFATAYVVLGITLFVHGGAAYIAGGVRRLLSGGQEWLLIGIYAWMSFE